MGEQVITRKTSTCNSLSLLEVTTSYKFDIFLSFRGPDTRRKFASHLYDRFRSVGFQVYLDEEEMDKGEEINEDLKQAIVNSIICMPIFSKNYASSKACLLELSHMVQCGKKIIPIFYDVTPDDVKLKTPLYKEHLEDYKNNPKVELDDVVKWEKALLTVAKRSGYVLLNKNEAKEITAITQDLVIKLMPKHQDLSDKLVEIEYEVKHVEELLDLRSNDFRIIGIFGLGGVGKTTLAKVIFNQLEPSFPSCCSFLENVRENLQSGNLLSLQRQLYKDIINLKIVDSIHGYNHGINMIKQGLASKKVLLILDDISEGRQLTYLVGNDASFKSGSRLIITTRDRQVLDDLNRKYNVLAYDLKEMDDDRSLKLFSRCAFMEDSPPKEFQSLSKEVISYTGGLPLVIEVFGSSLYGSSKDAWNKILDELKKFPDKSIEDRLMISYQGLKSNEQNIFLDIACYYEYLNKGCAWYMWEDCGWCSEPALKTLKSRSLVKIIGNTGNERLWMHDVLKDLGMAIIRAEGEKNNRIPCRLRIINDLEVLHETKEKAHVETLTIHAPTITITREDLVGLQNLRFLELKVAKIKVDFTGLFPNLRWFCCDTAEVFKPINFNPKKLLVLHLYSVKSQKWEGWRRMKVDKLKSLVLKDDIPQVNSYWFSAHADLRWILNATNLERLSLGFTDPVTGIEDMSKLSWLRHLYLYNVKFQHLPNLPSSLLHLTLNYCEFVNGILDVTNLKNLILLKINSPDKLNEIKGLGELYSLEVLLLEALEYLPHLPSSLLHLTLTECEFHCGILDVPNLKNLGFLKISYPRKLNAVKGLGELYSLKILILEDLDLSLWNPQGMPKNLKDLTIIRCWQDIWCFDGLESLTSLSIFDCQFLRVLEIPTLRKLNSLELEKCFSLFRIQGIPKLECLEIVKISDCNALELSPLDFTKLEHVQSSYISQCRNPMP